MSKGGVESRLKQSRADNAVIASNAHGIARRVFCRVPALAGGGGGGVGSVTGEAKVGSVMRCTTRHCDQTHASSNPKWILPEWPNLQMRLVCKPAGPAQFLAIPLSGKSTGKELDTRPTI